MSSRILLTGVAGFIGMHTAKYFLENGFEVYGIDNLNDYYDVTLKRDRLSQINHYPNFIFRETDITDREEITKIFSQFKPEFIVHLAAQAGVRYSLENPHAYINSNIYGFLNILEACRSFPVSHLVYASSSSVYGANTKIPFSEKDGVDHPVSLYAVTKRSNELMAHSYSHLYQIPTTGLRFFTVYGPWGRPDMALFLFTKAIYNDEEINVFNHGEMIRDFTYIDDFVNSIFELSFKPPTLNTNQEDAIIYPDSSSSPFKVFNIGNSSPVPLKIYISALENAIGRKAKKNYLSIQPGDVVHTHSDSSSLEKWINFRPKTDIEEGIEKFVSWFNSYYH